MGLFSQNFLRIARTTLYIDEFNHRANVLVSRLCNQGGKRENIYRQLKKAALNHPEAFLKYRKTAAQIVECVVQIWVSYPCVCFYVCRFLCVYISVSVSMFRHLCLPFNVYRSTIKYNYNSLLSYFCPSCLSHFSFPVFGVNTSGSRGRCCGRTLSSLLNLFWVLSVCIFYSIRYLFYLRFTIVF